MLASDPVQHCRAVAAPLGDIGSPKQSVVAKHSTAQSVRVCVCLCVSTKKLVDMPQVRLITP